MTSIKYVGMDVHTENTSIAVRNSVGSTLPAALIGPVRLRDAATKARQQGFNLRVELSVEVFGHSLNCSDYNLGNYFLRNASPQQPIYT